MTVESILAKYWIRRVREGPRTHAADVRSVDKTYLHSYIDLILYSTRFTRLLFSNLVYIHLQ